MSEKLISAEKLISTGVVLGKIEKEIREIPFIADPYAAIRTDYDIGYNNALAMAKAIVMNAPAVDAVEVVRCGDCRSYLPENHNFAKHCQLTGTEMDEDGFCSYGERRENNEID